MIPPVQPVGLGVVAWLPQVDGQVGGGAEGVGVVLTQRPPAAGRDVLIQPPGLGTPIHQTATATDGLGTVLDGARCVLLDFDGPVCSVFAGYPAPTVAAHLRRLLIDQGVSLAGAMLSGSDPLEVLRCSATLGRRGLVRRVDEALRTAEVTAIASAAPTPYAREAIVAWHDSGRRVAVVSNNAAEAVHAYLSAHGLSGYVHLVIGRAYADPTRMKPSPAPVLAAVRELGVPAGACVLVGDSVTDIEAAQAAGMRSIGYANKPGKRVRLADADALVDSMAELAIVKPIR